MHGIGQSVYKTWLVLEREIRTSIRGLRTLASLAIMLVLLLVSGHLSLNHYRERLASWVSSQAARSDATVGGVVSYRLPDGVFHHSVGTGPGPPSGPPTQLSMLVLGMDAEMTRPVSVHQRVIFAPAREPGVAPTEAPDFLMIVTLFGSLLALFFSFDLVVREKEAGTLRVMIAHGVRYGELIVGKALGASINFAATFAIAYFGAIAYLHFQEELLSSPERRSRVLLIFGLCLLYNLVFIALGLFISTITSQVKTAVVVALLSWACVVLVLPNAAVLAARLIYPTPSYNELEARLFEARQRIVQRALSAYPAARSVFDTATAKETLFQTYEEDRRLTDEYFASALRQIDRASLFAVLCPAGAFSSASSDLAGTGVGAYRAHIDLLRAGRDAMIEALKYRWEVAPHEGDLLLRRAADDVSSRLSAAEPRPAGSRFALLARGSLLAWLLLFAFGTYWRFRRYDAR